LVRGRIFVTGGSGFVGSAVIAELRRRDWAIDALVNQRALPGDDPNVRSIKGGMFDANSLDAMRDCQAVIHLVGIIKEQPSKGITFERIHYEGAKSIIDATKRAGEKRYVQMSALGVRPNAVSVYHQTKFKAEEYVRSSELDWTIIRPSLIHGPRGEFMAMEARWARKQAPPFIAMPYFGRGLLGTRGAGMLQPVFVEDVSRAFADALDRPQTIQQTYELGGAERLSWPQMHEAVANAIVGHRRWVLPFPAPIAKFYAAIGLGKLLGFTRDQVIMSQEDNTCDLTKFKSDFGWEPQAFETTLKTYARQL
jgi:uncharacterized protein YbjT (DUF2867 family)